MNRLLLVSAIMILACVSVDAASKKTVGAGALSTKHPGTKILNITVQECKNLHGGLILSTTCHSGGACRTTSVNGDGEVVYHDECLSVK